MSIHQKCANCQIGFIQRLTPWYFCRFAPSAAHMFIIMFYLNYGIIILM